MKRFPRCKFRRWTSGAAAGLALALSAVWPVPGHASPVSTSGIVASNTEFAFDLYRELRAGEGNLFLSPYSISAALAMAWAGARGETERQMGQALHFDAGQDATHEAFQALRASLAAARSEGATLDVANALWPQQGEALLPEYVDLVRERYGVSITPLDYAAAAEAARATINAWVEQQTAGKIRDVIAPGVLDALTRLVLINAIYFKGNWMHPFSAFATHDAQFHVVAGRDVSVRMMSQKREFAYAELDDAQAVELPYADGELSMLVVLPKAVDGLAALEADLSAERLREWRDRLASEEIVVQLPRFEMTAQFRLDRQLSALGMADAFNRSAANFAGIDGRTDRLYLGAVLHKAFVEVNEEGTEAAAATAIVMPARALPEPPPVFRADHPFLFFILDRESGSVLFIGRLTDPTA